MLKYVEGQPNSIGVEENQSPEKAHDANQNAFSVGAFGKVPGDDVSD